MSSNWREKWDKVRLFGANLGRFKVKVQWMFSHCTWVGPQVDGGLPVRGDSWLNRVLCLDRILFLDRILARIAKVAQQLRYKPGKGRGHQCEVSVELGGFVAVGTVLGLAHQLFAKFQSFDGQIVGQ